MGALSPCWSCSSPSCWRRRHPVHGLWVGGLIAALCLGVFLAGSRSGGGRLPDPVGGVMSDQDDTSQGPRLRRRPGFQAQGWGPPERPGLVRRARTETSCSSTPLCSPRLCSTRIAGDELIHRVLHRGYGLRGHRRPRAGHAHSSGSSASPMRGAAHTGSGSLDQRVQCVWTACQPQGSP